MYKLSEQQINPKVLSVSNSCDYNENSKNGRKLFTDKCPPLGIYPNKSPRAKLECKNPGVEAKSPGVRCGIVMAKTNSCIKLTLPGGGALECNLMRRCPFFKNLHNPFGKKICISIPCFGIIRLQKIAKSIGE